MATDTEFIKDIVESNVPLDWVTLRKFSEITGEKENWLYKLKDKLPKGDVWHKKHGKIYFSLVGWNTWHNNQTTQRALESEDKVSKLISPSMANVATSRSRKNRLQQVSKKQEKYVLT